MCIRDRFSYPRVPIYHGYHICDHQFVNKFKSSFVEAYSKDSLTEADLGPLFNNPVMHKCQILSQSASFLRLFQFKRFFIDSRE